MDLVFKRYSGPFFLDYVISNNNLDEFVDMLIKKTDEEKLWEVYLASIYVNQKSFDDWKKELTKDSSNENVPKMSKKEIDATIKKSQEILSGFKPPQKGGK